MSQETLVVSKPAWASKGVIGSVIVILVGTLGVARLFIPALKDVEIDSGELAGVVTSAITLICGAIALIGRVRAKAPIHIINRKTVPGGPWNPAAEVRRTKRVRRPRFPMGEDGAVRLGGIALTLGMCAIMAGLASTKEASPASERPSLMSPPSLMSHSAPRLCKADITRWLAPRPATDHRPFLVRLLASLRVSATPRLPVRQTSVSVRGGADF